MYLVVAPILISFIGDFAVVKELYSNAPDLSLIAFPDGLVTVEPFVSE